MFPRTDCRLWLPCTHTRTGGRVPCLLRPSGKHAHRHLQLCGQCRGAAGVWVHKCECVCLCVRVRVAAGLEVQRSLQIVGLMLHLPHPTTPHHTTPHHTHLHANTHTHTYARTPAHIHIHTHTHSHAQTLTHTRAGLRQAGLPYHGERGPGRAPGGLAAHLPSRALPPGPIAPGLGRPALHAPGVRVWQNVKSGSHAARLPCSTLPSRPIAPGTCHSTQ